ncbi:MAG: hypothetical protein H6Q66_187 [Firmicutes bacterium]|nr:hypothetical protein [Bacillota bacterium]
MTWVIGFFLFVNFIYLYFERPVFAFGFTDWSLPMLFWGWILLFYLARPLLQKGRAALSNSPWGRLLEKLFLGGPAESGKVVDISGHHISPRIKKVAMAGAALMAIGILNLIVLPVMLSHPFFFSQSYRNLLGTVEESSFTADVEPINLSQIRIIDEETAIKLAEKKVGEVPALGSETRLGDLVLQKVQNRLYYVAPLEHRGIFQWMTNFSQGSKGYVMVSATNPQDVRLVQHVNGNPVYLKVQTNGFVMDYLPRFLYFHGIITAGMADYSFEIDDDLNPYWVVTLYKNKVGYSGPDAVGVVLVNAQTGEIKKYSTNDVPAWVDRIQPENFVYRQIASWGDYVNGYWNSLLAKTGTLKPTGDRLHLIYGNDDRVYWYTGITSSGRDESSVGFLLVNSRTKDAKWYKVAGATESAARKSAEGQVQEKGYRAGYPILYNIHGVPTYIAPLKDKEGLLKLVSFISVENYNLVGVGADIDSALRAYQLNLINKGNAFIPGHEIKPVRLQAKVTRFSQVVKGGESYFYFTLEGDPRIFVGTINNSPKLSLVRPNDTIAITFNESREAEVSILQLETGGF